MQGVLDRSKYRESRGDGHGRSVRGGPSDFHNDFGPISSLSHVVPILIATCDECFGRMINQDRVTGNLHLNKKREDLPPSW